jgi:Transposase zinc-binding domain/Putative transposase
VAAQCGISAASRAVQEPAIYRRRRPAESVLYRVVQEHLETYLALARGGSLDTDPVPRFVEREFRRYLECGILAHGFARARCSECGHDSLIAFSCKGRGVCPSWNTRRMVRTAARLVDEVFPRQPVRQWVLSVPKRLRYFLHHDPAVVSSVLHLFLRVVEETLRQSSPGAGSEALFGAVSFLHRFGSALNPHVHFHCAVIDGVFQPGTDGRLGFHEAVGLTEEQIAKVQEQVAVGCCESLSAVVCSSPRRPATCGRGKVAAASRWMPPSAWRRMTGGDWSGYCATVRDPLLLWSAWRPSRGGERH